MNDSDYLSPVRLGSHAMTWCMVEVSWWLTSDILGFTDIKS